MRAALKSVLALLAIFQDRPPVWPCLVPLASGSDDCLGWVSPSGFWHALRAGSSCELPHVRPAVGRAAWLLQHGRQLSGFQQLLSAWLGARLRPHPATRPADRQLIATASRHRLDPVEVPTPTQRSLFPICRQPVIKATLPKRAETWQAER